MLPHTILPKHKSAKHHKPDLIRDIGYSIHSRGALIKDPIYRGRRCLNLRECKYSTDINISDIIDHIHTIYAPLKKVTQLHNNDRLQAQVIRVVRSKTGNFHTRTFAEIAQLVSFKENPPDTVTYKSQPHQAHTIAMSLHIHAQEWLTLIFKVSRSNLTHRHSQKKTPLTTHDK